jgi:hypothetical protein
MSELEAYMICWAEKRIRLDGMYEQRRGKQSCHSLNHHPPPLSFAFALGLGKAQVVPPKENIASFTYVWFFGGVNSYPVSPEISS